VYQDAPGGLLRGRNFLRFCPITRLFFPHKPCDRHFVYEQDHFAIGRNSSRHRHLAGRRAGRGFAPEPPVFKDKNLEKVVRRFVFEKRDNDKPIVQADVVNLSTIQAVA